MQEPGSTNHTEPPSHSSTKYKDHFNDYSATASWSAYSCLHPVNITDPSNDTALRFICSGSLTPNCLYAAIAVGNPEGFNHFRILFMQGVLTLGPSLTPMTYRSGAVKLLFVAGMPPTCAYAGRQVTPVYSTYSQRLQVSSHSAYGICLSIYIYTGLYVYMYICI